MKRRILFGAVLIAATLALMWLDQWLEGRPLPGALSWFPTNTPGRFPAGVIVLLLGALVCARAGVELSRLFNATGIAASPKHLAWACVAGVFAGGLTIGTEGTLFLGHVAGTIQASAGAAVVFLSMLAYIRDKDVKGASGAVAASCFAFIYMGVVLGFLMAIRREYSVAVMLAVVFTVKSCDSGAYFVGSALGRHKMVPWISPGKSWEGLVGGVFVSAIVGGLFALWSHTATHTELHQRLPHLTLVHGVILGAILGVVGQAGDLSESVLKRDAGVKDAGRILPGFGGMIDMLDSLIIAAPVAYWYFAALRPDHPAGA